MKFNELKQAMDWRRRVGFNGGGYVKKKVLPQPKPKEEAEKVNKARKEKTFEKAKPALENPKEVKEMIDKPKRGLVDEPGSYGGQTKEQKKIAEKNIAKWKKANPTLKFEDLSPGSQTSIRKGSLTTGRKGIIGGPEAEKNIAAWKKANPNLNFEDLTSSQKSQIRTGTGTLRTGTGTGVGGQVNKKYIPYKDKFLKLYEKLKKDKRKTTVTGLAQETIDALKGTKNEIKNIDLKNFTNIMLRSFLTEAQLKDFLTTTEANLLRNKEAMTPKKIIFQNIIDGKSNIGDLAKASGLSEKEVQKTVNKIIIEIPLAKKQSALNQSVSNVVLRDFKVSDYEKFRKQITNESSLSRVFRKGILELVTDAYKDQPKKLERATKRINAYFKIKQALEKKGIKLALDHPLAFKTIESLGNTDPEKLIRVTPISQELNNSLKRAFDKRYRDILTGLQDDSIRGENRKKLITDKINIEKLAKDINLPFGKVAKTGKIVDFGTPEFLKKDLGKEIKEGVKLEDRIIKSLNKIPNIADRFKEVFGTTQSKALELAEKLKGQKNLPQLIKVINALIRKNPGLAADASDFLNKISDAIVSPVAAAEVLPGQAQAATPKPMDFDLDMSLPTPTKKDITAETTAALTPLVMKYGPSVAKGLGNIFNRLGTPLFQAAYAAVDPASLMFSAPFTQASNVPSGVYKQPKGIMQKLSRSANRLFLPQNIASRAIQGLSRASTFGFPVFKAGEELFKTRGRIRDFEQRMTPMERNNPENFQMTAAGRAPKELVRQFMRELPQDAFEYTGAAGGGLLKQAGDRSGKPPEAGPNSQGLDFLMKRGR